MKANPDGIWEVIDTSEVRQIEWGFPANLFIGNKDLIDVRISGKISVQGDEDNDFMGIVFGYKQPTNVAVDATYDMYLFDWKAEEENLAGLHAYEGFRLSRYNGFITRDNQRAYFYMEVDSPPTRDVLVRSYGEGKGWEYYREYEIELLFTSGRIEIYIDSELIFERNICSTPGKFGFYTMSQPYVHFNDFYYEDYTIMYQSHDSVCRGTEIDFTPYNPQCGSKPGFITNVTWDFGDGQTSQLITPKHTYSNPGDYEIKLIINDGSPCADTLVSNVTILDMPVVDLGANQIVPVCSSVQLDAQNAGSVYDWSTGENSQVIELINIPNDTIIWVEVNKLGCKESDTVNIQVENPETRIFLPNAFTPNNDGNNDVFIPVGINSFITDYKMNIYNRWGQLIFESENPTEGWNGFYNSEPCPMATYTYSMSYRAETCVSERNEKVTGMVTLIR